MPATKVSNPRDLLVQLLGQLLFVERRLADCVLAELVSEVRDEELRHALQDHRDETKQHVERVEIAFRKLTVAPTSNLSRPFESAVSEHDELQSAVQGALLADIFHAQAALHTEHWEIATYATVIALGDAMAADAVAPLRESLKDEERARDLLAKTIDRLAQDAAGRRGRQHEQTRQESEQGRST
jgi:ferritin-like metal-binding protein YciE